MEYVYSRGLRDAWRSGVSLRFFTVISKGIISVRGIVNAFRIALRCIIYDVMAEVSIYFRKNI